VRRFENFDMQQLENDDSYQGIALAMPPWELEATALAAAVCPAKVAAAKADACCSLVWHA
jgi:hypothetical protein